MEFARNRCRGIMPWICLVTVALAITSSHGEGPAAKLPASAPVPVSALKFIRQDAELWQARTTELAKLQVEARQSADRAAQALAEVRQRLQKIDQEAVAAQMVLKALLPPGTKTRPLSIPKTDSEKSDPPKAASPSQTDTKLAAPKDKATAPPAQKADEPAIVRARERLQQVLEQQTQARKQLTQAEQELKRSQTTRDALVKAHTEAETLHKQAAERVTLMSRSPQIAKPENARLIQTFSAPRPVLTARWDQAGRGFFAGIQGSDVLRYDLYRSAAGASTNSTAASGFVEMKGHHSWVGSLAVAPGNEHTLLSGSYNGHLIWWNTQGDTPSLIRDRVGHQGFVRAVAYSPDGRLAASCGNDLVVRVWDSSGVLVRELRGHNSHVYNVAFHPSGRYLVSGDLMGILKQWDTSTWQLARELDAKVLEKYDETFVAHCGGIRSLDFSPDGRQLVVSGVSDVTNAFAGLAVPTAVLFDWETGKRLRILKPQNTTDGSCWGVRFSPAGDFIVGAGGRGSGSLWFWKPSDEKSFFDLRLPNVPYDVQFHPDGLRLLLPLYDATIRVYDLGPKVEAPAAIEAKPPLKKEDTKGAGKKAEGKKGSENNKGSAKP